MKVLVNNFWGGFCFSEKAIKLICRLKKLNYAEAKNNYDMFDTYHNPDIRTDKDAISVVEQLRDAASTSLSKIVVAEIPDGSYFKISEYDGFETLYYSSNKIRKFKSKPITA